MVRVPVEDEVGPVGADRARQPAGVEERPDRLGLAEPDLRPVLEIARSVREQVDWDAVRLRTAGFPFARAFFALVEDLGIMAGATALRLPTAQR